MEQETIYGQIVAKANNYLAVPALEANKKRIIKNDRVRQYERDFARQCKIYRGRGIDCSFTLHVSVYHSSIRYDLDNSLKTLLDCLQQVRAITDDKLCYKIVAEKFVDRFNPRIVFGIEPHQAALF